MTTTINATPTNGLVATGDGSGVLKVQSNGVTTNALAWVNFNGSGTVAIRSSYNVSSITDNGTGDYTVNFATALSDANYSSTVSVNYQATLTLAQLNSTGVGAEVAPTTSAFRFITISAGAANVDAKYVSVTVHGN